MIRLDLSRLDYHLFQIASRASGQKSGVVEIDINGLALASETRFKFAQASADYEVVAEEARKKAAAPPPPPPAPEPLPEQIDMAALEDENQREMKARADQARATQRLTQYAAAGLEDTQANSELIKDFVETSAANGYWSFEVVEAAIQNLGPKGSNQLTWKPKVVAALTSKSKPKPSEVLGKLPNGEDQLPLEISESRLRKASLIQVKDWKDRKEAADGVLAGYRWSRWRNTLPRSH